MRNGQVVYCLPFGSFIIHCLYAWCSVPWWSIYCTEQARCVPEDENEVRSWFCVMNEIWSSTCVYSKGAKVCTFDYPKLSTYQKPQYELRSSAQRCFSYRHRYLSVYSSEEKRYKVCARSWRLFVETYQENQDLVKLENVKVNADLSRMG